MVKSCCVRGCRSESYANCGISFHSFPKNISLRTRWIDALGCFSDNLKSKFVCSRHFTKKDFKATNLPRLVDDAVPFVVPPTKRITVLSDITIKIQENIEPPAKLARLDNGTQTDSMMSSKEESLIQKVRCLHQKLNRRNTKITSLKMLLETVKRKCKNYDEVQLVMKNNFNDIHKHFNVKKSNTGVRYSDELKQFALTLYFYSGPAYNFLRNRIALPHPATLRKILSTTECNVGFMKEAFDYLRSLSTSGANNDTGDVALLFDAMSIKSEDVFDKHSGKFVGYVDFGGILQPDGEILATEVLVFQIVSLKKKLKFPIAYFLTNKMTAHVQAQLLLTAIRMLSEVNINVRSLTCDGTVTNKSTYEILGCNFSMPDIMITHFKHPVKDQKVHCIFDPPHMVKLARNLFAETKLSSNTGAIDFRYVKDLHFLQEQEGLLLANKLCNAHINFFQKKMNVKLATQLLSSSVADAIEFMCKCGHPKFIGSEATVEFIRFIDRAFDVMNAKDPRGTGFKSPLRMENTNIWANVLKDTREYLCSLKVDGEPILTHRRKVPALGLVVNTFSFYNLALDFLHQNENKYFLPYKCSQDHLEMFFSCIRARGGSNNNPNALQLRYTLRKLLFQNSIKPSIHANCADEAFELSPIVEFRSKKRSLTAERTTESFGDEQQIETLFDQLENVNVSDFKANILYYITGAIVNRLLKKIDCEHCHNALLSMRKYNFHSYSIDLQTFSAFTTFVDRGGLKYVTEFPFEIVIFAEKLFNLSITTQELKTVTRSKLMMMTIQYFASSMQKFNLQHPLQSIEVEDNHEMQLLKAVASNFFNLRMGHHAKSKTLRDLGSKIGLRQKLHKTILFSNL